MLTVWGRATSSNVQAVMWGIAEMGLEAQRIDWGGRFGGLDDPAFRAINPFGLVPVLQDGARPAIFESAVILRYLAARYGGAAFWPQDPLARAEIDTWAEWGKHSCTRAFNEPVFWAHWRVPQADRDVAAIAVAIQRFEGTLQVAAGRIAQGGYMVGDRLSLADLWVGHTLHRYFTLDIDRAPPEEIVAYYARLTARAAYATHVMVDYSELKGLWGRGHSGG
ncbi:MAG: glutathione S-transferase family protein [Pseudomonadota bacterium]